MPVRVDLQTQLTPALIAKKGEGGRAPDGRKLGGYGFRGAVQYDADKEGSELIDTNLEGVTPREWSRQVKVLRQANQRCKRICDHWSLSLDPRHGKLSHEQWRAAAIRWMRSMGYSGCAYVIHRHTDEPQDHIHIALCRVRADGSVTSDSNDFKRSHVAAAEAAKALGLKPLPPRDDAAGNPAPTDAVVRAGHRASARGTKPVASVDLARDVRAALAQASDLDQLIDGLRQRGIEVQLRRRGADQSNPAAEISGWSLRAKGTEEWLGGASVARDRSLSWSRVAGQLNTNADTRRRAKRAVAEKVSLTHHNRRKESYGYQPHQRQWRSPQARAAWRRRTAKHLLHLLSLSNVAPLRLRDSLPVQGRGLADLGAGDRAPAAAGGVRWPARIAGDGGRAMTVVIDPKSPSAVAAATELEQILRGLPRAQLEELKETATNARSAVAVDDPRVEAIERLLRRLATLLCKCLGLAHAGGFTEAEVAAARDQSLRRALAQRIDEELSQRAERQALPTEALIKPATAAEAQAAVAAEIAAKRSERLAAAAAQAEISAQPVPTYQLKKVFDPRQPSPVPSEDAEAIEEPRRQPAPRG